MRVTAFSLVLVLVLVVAVAAAGCSSSPVSPSNNVPFSQSDLRAGTGAAAATGQTLSVNYTGWFYDASKADQKGLIFDSNRGRAAFSFSLGTGAVIDGWDQGLPGMQVGGLRRLVIPPSLAYGSSRRGSIPPNTTLLFEVELLQVQ
jgi:FKBP-type peptidyl-prolyl cis-trans isomerase FkpA